MDAWHCAVLQRGGQGARTGRAEHLLLSCNRFCSAWEMLPYSCRFYTPTTGDKLSVAIYPRAEAAGTATDWRSPAQTSGTIGGSLRGAR
jgi:hypothetical protein